MTRGGDERHMTERVATLPPRSLAEVAVNPASARMACGLAVPTPRDITSSRDGSCGRHAAIPGTRTAPCQWRAMR